MAFLELNGWTIPILKGGDRAPVVIGDRARAFDGSINYDRRVVKDAWRFETKEINADDATALVGLLLGQGHSWNFDADLYSGKGLGFGTTVGSQRPGTSINPVAQILGRLGNPESLYGAGSLAVEPATTNLLTAVQREASNTSGFGTVGGGSLATDTTYLAIDTGEATPTSIKHTRTATSQGVATSATSISSATSYAGSVYVMTLDSGVSVNFDLDDDIAAIDGSSASLVAGVWQRLDAIGTSDASATTATLTVTVTAGAAAGDIYIDALQLEAQSDGSTTWANPTRAAGTLAYPGGFLNGAKGFTFAAWVRGPISNSAAVRYFVHAQEVTEGLERIRLYRGAASNDLLMRVTANGATTTTITYSGSPWDNDWHHIAGVVGRTESGTFAGNTFARLYFDGVSVGSAFSIEIPDFDLMDTVNLGGLDESLPSNAMGADYLMDEAIVLPFAVTGDFIAAIAATTSPLGVAPKIRATGDAIHNAAGFELVEGTVTRRSYNGIVLDGVWHDNAQRVQFEIET